jgi:hypothetical protein
MPLNITNTVPYTGEPDKIEFVKLRNGSRSGKGMKLAVRIIKSIDRDTKQFVFYVPSLELTGYGNSVDRAFEMLNRSIDDFCEFITKLKNKEIEHELFKLGWKPNETRKKYSKFYVNPEGELVGLNLDRDKIEELTLTV